MSMNVVLVVTIVVPMLSVQTRLGRIHVCAMLVTQAVAPIVCLSIVMKEVKHVMAMLPAKSWLTALNAHAMSVTMEMA